MFAGKILVFIIWFAYVSTLIYVCIYFIMPYCVAYLGYKNMVIIVMLKCGSPSLAYADKPLYLLPGTNNMSQPRLDSI